MREAKHCSPIMLYLSLIQNNDSYQIGYINLQTQFQDVSHCCKYILFKIVSFVGPLKFEHGNSVL